MSELWIFRCPDRFPDSELIVPHRMVQMQFIELGTRGTDSFPLFVHMLISIYRATQKLVLVCVSSKKRTNQIEKSGGFQFRCTYKYTPRCIDFLFTTKHVHAFHCVWTPLQSPAMYHVFNIPFFNGCRHKQCSSTFSCCHDDISTNGNNMNI